jgi:hypothetical protein
MLFIYQKFREFSFSSPGSKAGKKEKRRRGKEGRTLMEALSGTQLGFIGLSLEKNRFP